MSKAYVTLTVEPRGDVYRSLLAYAVGPCTVALLVRRPDLPWSAQGDTVLAQLKKHLQGKAASSAWPGTRLLDAVAWVFRYAYTTECAAILARVAESLYSWQQPYLPEDLCLLRPDGTPWLVSIAHEQDSYLVLSAEEKAHLLAAIPQLRYS